MVRSASVLACLLLFGFSAPQASAQLAWADEFNSEKIDRSIWTFDVGGHGFGNGQLEYDTARRENAYIEDGKLVIEARREDYDGKSFTSARMLTQGRFAFRYGTLEARIKLPDTANGVWPAFWMLGNRIPAVNWPHCGEIDILEIGGKDGIAEGKQRRKINAAIHFSGANDEYEFETAWFDADVDLSADFHNYKVEWTAEHLKFYLDDREYGSFDIRAEHLSEFHRPAFPILNVAVGSWDSSYTGVSTPDQVTAEFPAKMYVDWIRLTKSEKTELFFGDEVAEQGNFHVFSESHNSGDHLRLVDNDWPGLQDSDAGTLYLWNNMVESDNASSPFEGQTCWTLDVKQGDWFGMGVFLANYRNMSNYSDGQLHFDVKTESAVPLKIGIKSAHAGEFFLPLGDEEDEFGFARDGRWQRVTIPLNRFANIDFKTVYQVFMLTGTPPDEDLTISIDNVVWEPSETRPKPHPGTYGVFTESPEHRSSGQLELESDGGFFVWEKTLEFASQTPVEGERSISLSSSQAASWFGCAFTPNTKVDLTSYSDEASRLCFSMKTSSDSTFMIGLKSGNIDGVGQKWFTFAPGRDPFDFKRDGQWHQVEIPMTLISDEVDLSAVSQLFQVLGRSGPISDIEFDDIYFSSEPE